MSRPFLRFLTILIAAPLLACGGSPTTPHVDPLANAPRKCRQYATALSIATTLNSGGEPSSSMGSQSCAFDTAARALRCTTSGGSCTTATLSKTYSSVADFIEETGAVGRDREATIESSCDAEAWTDIFTYDAQKRLVRRQRPQFSYDLTYTTWDTLGRPTRANAVFGACPETATIEYDDTARTVTSRYASVSGSGCGGFTETQAYDSVGDVVSYVYNDPGLSIIQSSTVAATAEVCL